MFGQLDLAVDGPGKLISPARRRQSVEHAQEVFQISERRVCRALEQPRSTQRYLGKRADDEKLLTERIVTLASQYGRYGYRRITAMLQVEGWLDEIDFSVLPSNTAITQIQDGVIDVYAYPLKSDQRPSTLSERSRRYHTLPR